MAETTEYEDEIVDDEIDAEEPAEDAAEAEDEQPPETELAAPLDNPEEAASTGPQTQPAGVSKVQVRPGRPFHSLPDSQSENYLLTVPTIPKTPGTYLPMPYIFRLSTVNSKINDSNFLIRIAPFHVLLDHTIAVVWLVLSENEYNSPLGIAQLHWANEFLKTIVKESGERPKDIQYCIDTIEQLIMDQYADLNKETDKLMSVEKKLKECAERPCCAVVKNIPFSLNYNEMIEKVPATNKEYEMKLKQSTMTQDEIEIELDSIRAHETLDAASKYEQLQFLNTYKCGQLDKIRNELKKLMSVDDLIKSMGVNDVNPVDDKLYDILNNI